MVWDVLNIRHCLDFENVCIICSRSGEFTVAQENLQSLRRICSRS